MQSATSGASKRTAYGWFSVGVTVTCDRGVFPSLGRLASTFAVGCTKINDLQGWVENY